MVDTLSIKDTHTQKSITISTSPGEYYLKELDVGSVDGKTHTFKYVNQIGVSVYGISLGTRDIRIIGWVADENFDRLIQRKKVLNSFINPTHLMELIVGGYKLSFYPGKSIKYSTSYEENNEVLCKFLIEGECPYPLFTPLQEQRVSVAYTLGKFRFPLTIPPEGVQMGVRQPSLIALVNNAGDFPVGYTIEFKATGSVSNPSLIDIGSQQMLKINKQMIAGESVTVNTREGERQIIGRIGGVEQNYFQYRTYESDWLTLGVGENLLRYNADSGVTNLEALITFSPGFMEVEP